MERLNRRGFLKGLSAGAVALAARKGWAYDPIPALNIKEITVRAGVPKPFSVLHVSDSHIARIDSRSEVGVWAFAAQRSRNGRELGEHYLNAAFEYAHRAGIKVIHTGDVMEFASAANLEYTERRFKSEDVLACVGNHEYWTTAATYEDSVRDTLMPQLRPVFPYGLPASTIEHGGISFFVFDNAFERVNGEIVGRFRETIAKRLPIVLVCHVPAYAAELDEKLEGLPGGPEWKPDAATAEFLKLTRAEPLVKAVLCGHLHQTWEGVFSPTARIYGAGALFNGEAQLIKFV